ncbi:MAG TPA: 50S ribosomal protein L5 [Methanomassiliicoccales archaeon]|jgi:large subunit ribosomal protein L5|nr:50S ribosomal protein L5 [Methanomassiliicoccales archaeon]HOO03181.1 50S ribosomal protein L5 [Methanomassiliicoccales archaeon]HPD08550.1 50S ribosomal protein L5 [Methanomassiliicoccales archaeon]HQM66245.1 50S ribosomal protein L5 [Methanomassiliicoccales archaeon]HRR66196.1 50S ribosomal protein L5 [Methanomassiliicoccales archaeon]
MSENVMRRPYLEKVVVNMGVGEAGERLVKAQKVIEMVTGQRSRQTFSKVTNRDFGIREGMPIGCLVTLRGERAEEFLRRAFSIRENRIPSYSFDREGNLSFGIADYTDFSGMKYDPEIGIFGMDISVSIQRPGRRVARRRIMRRSIPRSHRMTREEAMEFIAQKFNVEVID